jgi:hypothetical protein
MADAYKDFQREPSRAHQCMHESENDGARCRAMAMQNNYMCYAHRTDDVPTVIENDMFLIDNLDTHEAIQKVFLDVAARLACNHIDLKRAELLITLLRAASRNLRDAATARRQALREAAAEAKAVAAAAGAGAGAPGSTASSSTLGLNPADPLPNCHPERSSASAPNVVEGPAVAARTATNPRTSPKPPKRIYTEEEKNFLKWTTCSTHYAPVHRPRPESITDDDIIAAINAKRRICSLGPIETEPTWNRATLSTGPIDLPIPSSAKPITLPTLQAVACDDTGQRTTNNPAHFEHLDTLIPEKNAEPISAIQRPSHDRHRHGRYAARRRWPR